MSLLSKAEVQFLQGQKVISKSYQYKLKSIIKKKIAVLTDKELPLLGSLFPDLDLTKISKEEGLIGQLLLLPKFLLLVRIVEGEYGCFFPVEMRLTIEK